MSSDQIRSLSSLVKIKGGKRLPAGKSLQLIPNAHPYIRVRDLGQRELPRSGLEYVPDELFPPISRYIVEPNDIVLSIVGTIGALSIVDANYNLASLTENCVKLHGLDRENALYLYYFLLSPYGQQEIHRGTVGAVQPKLPIYNIEKIGVYWPEKSARQNTALLLGALDDRIALLRETNTTLEAIAQALFKSWFVDFDPVHAKMEGREPEGMDTETAELFPDSFEESELGMIPKGWRVGTIDDVCNFQNGYAFKSTEMSKSKDDTYKIFKMGNIKKGGGLNRTGTKDYFEIGKSKQLGRYLLKKGDLLMCMTDMKNNVALLGHTALMDIDDEFLLNQRVGMLRSKNKEIANYPFLYILTNSDSFIADLRNRANSGVQVNLSTQEIKNTKFILQTKQVHHSFNQVVEAIYEKLFILEQQQDCLSDIRDTLLPRLISGQLRLPEADNQFEESVL